MLQRLHLFLLRCYRTVVTVVVLGFLLTVSSYCYHRQAVLPMHWITHWMPSIRLRGRLCCSRQLFISY